MKQNIKKWLIIFFSFMLIANIACRIKDTYMIPRVKVENPIRTKLEHSFQTEGYFTSSSRNYIQPQAGWKIGKVFADAGMQVQEEDVLWQYDVAFLEELLSEKQDRGSGSAERLSDRLFSGADRKAVARAVFCRCQTVSYAAEDLRGSDQIQTVPDRRHCLDLQSDRDPFAADQGFS